MVSFLRPPSIGGNADWRHGLQGDLCTAQGTRDPQVSYDPFTKDFFSQVLLLKWEIFRLRTSRRPLLCIHSAHLPFETVCHSIARGLLLSLDG